MTTPNGPSPVTCLSVAAALWMAGLLVLGTEAAASPATRSESAASELPLGAEAVLYPVRDRVFGKFPGGRRAVALFYEHFEDILAVSLAEPEVREAGIAWLLSWQEPLRALVDGDLTAALSAEHVSSLQKYVEVMKAKGSPTLRAALDLEQRRMQVSEWAGLALQDFLQHVEQLSCEESETVLCLNGGRYRVEARWQTVEGRTGTARAVQLTSDTGVFWFFDRENLEVMVKVLDACSFSGHQWLFAAGLTDVEVELTVADTETGIVRTYENALATPFQPIQDTAAFSACGSPKAHERSPQADLETPPRGALRVDGQHSPLSRKLESGRTCVPTVTSLCLAGGRFEVQMDWRTADGDEGQGMAVPLAEDTGSFWFFDGDNLEAIVKVLDGCGVNSRRWVFLAGLTDVDVTTTVTDLETGSTRTYRNSLGRPFMPVQDTSAFANC